LLAIQTECIRPNIDVMWANDFLIRSKDPSLTVVKKSYLQFKKITGDPTNEWKQIFNDGQDPLYRYYIDTFGEHVNEESIRHVHHLWHTRYKQEFANPYIEWVHLYHQNSNIQSNRSFVQISNP
jgi:hypothetical protein